MKTTRHRSTQEVPAHFGYWLDKWWSSFFVFKLLFPYLSFLLSLRCSSSFSLESSRFRLYWKKKILDVILSSHRWCFSFKLFFLLKKEKKRTFSSLRRVLWCCFMMFLMMLFHDVSHDDVSRDVVSWCFPLCCFMLFLNKQDTSCETSLCLTSINSQREVAFLVIVFFFSIRSDFS